MDWLHIIGSMDFMGLRIPIPLALATVATVATVGYIMGWRGFKHRIEPTTHSKRELRKARCVARDLEVVANTVRKNISSHLANVTQIKEQLATWEPSEQVAAWTDLCQEAQNILTPTLQLASQIANAYDQIHPSGNHLVAFTEVRTDPLTGVGNHRSLNEAVGTQFAMMNRYCTQFSLVLFSIDHFEKINNEQGHLKSDRLIKRVARLLDESIREIDIVARYSSEEFMVVVPQTDLDGTCHLAERWRKKVQREMPFTMSGGVTMALDGDNAESLMARAEAALHDAKAAGCNRAFRHTGDAIKALAEEIPV